jgi:hypothetical protein
LTTKSRTQAKTPAGGIPPFQTLSPRARHATKSSEFKRRDCFPKEEIRFYKAILDNIYNCVMITEQDGRIIFSARPMESFLGLIPMEPSGKIALKSSKTRGCISLVKPESLKWINSIASCASELTFKEMLSLPFYPEITPGEIGEVAEAIRSFSAPWQDKQEDRL